MISEETLDQYLHEELPELFAANEIPTQTTPRIHKLLDAFATFALSCKRAGSQQLYVKCVNVCTKLLVEGDCLLKKAVTNVVLFRLRPDAASELPALLKREYESICYNPWP